MAEPHSVSVVIPVYNNERYLGDAIQSVLEQTFQPLELLVVDDGSTDGTPGLLRRFGDRVRSVRQPHAGIGAAVNRGIELTSGKFFASLDADDLWLPDMLSRQMAAFIRDPGLDLVFGHVRQFHSAELKADQRAAMPCSQEPVPGLSRGAMLVRRDALARVGPFGSEWRLGEFIDWYARAMESGLRSVVLEDVVMLRRLHGANTTVRERGEVIDYVRIIRAMRARRGASAAPGPARDSDA